MGKVLLLFLLGVVAWWMWRKLQAPSRRSNPPASRPVESMVSCARCGVNQPRSECVESVASPGVFFCSEIHRREAEPER